jgi:hypothetical protein
MSVHYLTQTKSCNFFSFCLSLVFHDRDISCKVQQQSVSTAQHSTAQHSTAQHSTAQHSTAQHSSISLDICSPLKKRLDGNVLHVYHSRHQNSLGETSNTSEGSVFVVTCCGLISGSFAKGCLQAPHSLEPFCFPKILLLKI